MMIRGRGLLCALAVGVAAGTLVATAPAASGPARLHFPRDHFAHAGDGIEWWYATGLVRGSDSRRYTVFFTLFRRGGLVLPVSQVVDLGHDSIVGHSERLAPATLGPARLDVTAGGASLGYDAESNTWRVGASAPGYSLSLSAHPEKPYVLHGGGTGFIRQSLGGSSAYYSATRMAARGVFTAHGRRITFTGEAWLDHQWGSFQKDPRAFNWDWFSCRFADRTELMLYRFRDRRTGKPLPRYASGTFVRADGTSVALRRFTAASDGRHWPQAWRLRVPGVRLDLRLRSLARDQLFRGVLVPTFWEGASTVTGTKQGDCFVEVTYR